MEPKKATFEEWFITIVPKAARLHPFTWCVKRQEAVLTVKLLELRCWECSEFVLNKGVCDPL